MENVGKVLEWSAPRGWRQKDEDGVVQLTSFHGAVVGTFHPRAARG